MVHNIKPEALRAGFAAMAKKDKIWPALQALCLEPDGSLVASDGHILIVCQDAVTPAPTDRLLIEITDKRALPKHATSVELDTEANQLRISHARGQDIRAIVQPNAEYAPYEHVMPHDERILPTAYAGFNTQLLLRASQALSADLVEIMWYGPGAPARIRPQTETAETADIMVYIMPLRATDRAEAYQAALTWGIKKPEENEGGAETE